MFGLKLVISSISCLTPNYLCQEQLRVTLHARGSGDGRENSGLEGRGKISNLTDAAGDMLFNSIKSECDGILGNIWCCKQIDMWSLAGTSLKDYILCLILKGLTRAHNLES